MIDPDSVEQVRQAADLVELLRGRVELKRRSGRWWAECPFHDERSPSFSILPDGKRYHCFGCGVSGDAFTWMREREGAGTFNEAVEALAERFGVELKYVKGSPQEEAQRAAGARRLTLLGRACDFYVAYLWKAPEAEVARRYMIERGFTEELLRHFRVGYAPSSGGLLTKRALQEGFSRQELLDSGLSRQSGADFFAARIMFPIADARGRVQGFGGRTLDPNERAKYVNSAEGPSFRKRRLLFGLDLARASAGTAGWIAVCEGYTDVMGLAKAGMPNAVACMGTSLTTDQLRLLSRTAEEIRICFDGDRAGQEAAWRSVEAAEGVKVRLSAVPLPVGKDPGDLSGTDDGLAELREAVTNPVPMMSYLVRSRVGRAGRSAAERDGALEEVRSLLRRFPDSIEKDDAIRLASGLLELSRPMEDRLRTDASQGRSEASRRPASSARERLGADEVRERRFLAMALALPEVGAKYVEDLNEEMFDLPIHRRAFALLASGTPTDGWPEELSSLATVLQSSVVDEHASEAELREATLRIQERGLERLGRRAREGGNVEEFLRIQDLLRRVRQAMRATE